MSANTENYEHEKEHKHRRVPLRRSEITIKNKINIEEYHDAEA